MVTRVVADEQTVKLPVETRRRQFGGGRVPLAISKDLQGLVRDLRQGVPLDARWHGLERVHEIFKAHGTTPVLLLEDTDAWASLGPVTQFFQLGVRMLVREVGLSSIVAVHPAFLTDPGYRRVRDLLVQVELPTLAPADEGLVRIVDHRIALTGCEGATADVLDYEALAELAQAYRTIFGGSLRKTLNSLSDAVESAGPLFPDCLDRGAIRASIAASS